jgi:allantoinase
MAWEPKRDFIGYAGKPPNPQWPNGARLAINFVVNYEEGSEASMQDGEGYTETALTEASTSASDVRGRDLGGESMFEYGSRVGFWRLHRLFQERNLPITVLSEAEEREHIRKAVESIQRMTGERPYGWYSRYAPSVNTRRLLVEEGGFLYDSETYNDELPYWTTVTGKPHLVIPYTITNNDTKLLGNIGSTADWLAYIQGGFDMLYAEGANAPKMMNVGLHMRIMGHPARAWALQRFLDHVMKHKDVWVARRVDIARHWIKTHPYPGTGLNE